ncbi:type VI secretion protein, partial [Escherichia coli]|nr:type VI secretion protein [Escherichia coli]
MTAAENHTVPEMNKTVEQMLAQGQWQDALDFWINNTDSLTL